MANVLIIKGHPLTPKESTTLKGLATFTKVYQEKNPQDHLEVLDVFSDDVPEIDETLLTAWNILKNGGEFSNLSEKQQKAVQRFDELTNQFLKTDKFVIANPLWNLNLPTKVKAWIDSFMVAGKTFCYTENGPMGMIEGKKMFHIQSSGGFYEGKDPASLYLNGIFNFIGVKDIQSAYIEGIEHHPDKAEEILAKAMKNIKKIAQEF